MRRAIHGNSERRNYAMSFSPTLKAWRRRRLGSRLRLLREMELNPHDQMSTSQLTRAVEALYSCVNELHEIVSDTIDTRDARLENLGASLEKLMTIIYIEKDEETGR